MYQYLHEISVYFDKILNENHSEMLWNVIMFQFMISTPKESKKCYITCFIRKLMKTEMALFNYIQGVLCDK